MKLIIGILYPELMSTYGDRGNSIILAKRCIWRGIESEIRTIDFKTSTKELAVMDIVLGGGAQDRQQAIVIEDLRERMQATLKSMFEGGIPGLFVCGSPQLLGHTYQMADGTKLQGLGIFDMETKHPGKGKERCIGNLVCTLEAGLWEDMQQTLQSEIPDTFVGFENHGGRTFLGNRTIPLAMVRSGYGNNGKDKTEGARLNHCLATYSHGPLLSKNPHIADYLIAKALQQKYGKIVPLETLDDSMIWKAHQQMIEKK